MSIRLHFLKLKKIIKLDLNQFLFNKMIVLYFFYTGNNLLDYTILHLFTLNLKYYCVFLATITDLHQSNRKIWIYLFLNNEILCVEFHHNV